jgi:heat shock protein HslJ
MCAEPIMEQESLFLAAVGSASVLSVTGTDLELRRDDGALAVQAQAKPLEEE